MPKINKKPMRAKKLKARRAAPFESESITVPAAGSMITRRRPIPPSVKTQGTSTFVRNTEMVGQVAMSVLFATGRVPIIPFFDTTIGTWLNGLALLYSKWRFHFLKFVYMPVVPTTTPGQVVLGLGYDHTDNSPGSIINASQSYNAINFPAWGGFNGTNAMNDYSTTRTPGTVSVLVDSSRLGGPSGDSFYRTCSTADFTLLSLPDRNIFSPGYLDISVIGGTTVVVGNIFGEYIIEFIEPINPSANA